MLERIKDTVAFISERIDVKPHIGIILGSGLGELAHEIESEVVIPYDSIPNFPVSTVKGHHGQLIFGKLNGVQVVAMKGRFHYYEGYSMEEVTLPIRVMKLLGIDYLFVSNASGGVNSSFEVGDIMFITDHINLMPNPLIGENIDDHGPRFVDMSEAYDKRLLSVAKRIARHNGINYKTGVYAGVSGPTYETPAEYKYINILGADAVGMSTVPEVIVARHMKLPVFAVSVISDLGVEGKIIEISHKEVIEAVSRVTPKLIDLIKEIVKEL
ncbi:MAG: purine-nucleoside phosphorylase [Lentimicrobiaceae bacterium]|nr:purine-nucleoside phosphorylase [Lentimicrobiaceae bacterium]MBT5731177.1 purine-nucleoside phosphorylase [Lentimicrobiaceae bacterium]MBT6671768.1 purine-nucleoside phosphorylase [Lentimicrobiaceae bacterium]MBT6963629.1 purine-nucleoside phosphorylase [Lentimicrobiaceae bacterium]MBT7621173.1 purine-nucleoside phosphorylase [Lentimicrobiaceae bacterium]